MIVKEDCKILESTNIQDTTPNFDCLFKEVNLKVKFASFLDLLSIFPNLLSSMKYLK